MNRLASSLLLSLLLAQHALAAEPQAEDYTLSMAGALINDRCERTWQNEEFVNIHACNYQLANRYTLEISTAHFEQCALRAQGDIVMIADCMVEQFSAWLEEDGQ